MVEIEAGTPVRGIYSPVGFVRTFGVKGTVLITGVAVGGLTAAMTYFATKNVPEEEMPGDLSPATASAAAGVGTGLLAGAFQYFQARGVTAGIPTKERE